MSKLTDQGLSDILTGLADARRIMVQRRDEASATLAKAEADFNAFNKSLGALDHMMGELRAEKEARAAEAGA